MFSKLICVQFWLLRVGDICLLKLNMTFTAGPLPFACYRLMSGNECCDFTLDRVVV